MHISYSAVVVVLSRPSNGERGEYYSNRKNGGKIWEPENSGKLKGEPAFVSGMLATLEATVS